MQKVIQKFQVGDYVRFVKDYYTTFRDKSKESYKITEVRESKTCPNPCNAPHEMFWVGCSCPNALTGYIMELENKGTYSQRWLEAYDKELEKLQNFYKDIKNQTSYKILNINPNGAKKEIKKAFIKLIKEYHPDHFQSPTHKEVANKISALINKAFTNTK